MASAGFVAHWREKQGQEMLTEFWSENMQGQNSFVGLNVCDHNIKIDPKQIELEVMY
jgi:hypothetical protein